MSVHDVYERFCDGQDAELDEAVRKLAAYHNDVFAHKRVLSWVDLTELEAQQLKAALRAGYRMALRDLRARIEEVGIG